MNSQDCEQCCWLAHPRNKVQVRELGTICRLLHAIAYHPPHNEQGVYYPGGYRGECNNFTKIIPGVVQC